jgi:hypothetical protein
MTSVFRVASVERGPVPEKDVGWNVREDGHAAFYAATLHYDRLAARSRAFPAICAEDWREIENALDVEHALDVA